ncbi:MAG: hypothetical protein V9G14_14250 [Cypionkella sp.]
MGVGQGHGILLQSRRSSCFQPGSELRRVRGPQARLTPINTEPRALLYSFPESPEAAMETNATPFYDQTINTTGCCAKFSPEGWDGVKSAF